jgi:hypothetical protein
MVTSREEQTRYARESGEPPFRERHPFFWDLSVATPAFLLAMLILRVLEVVL